MRPSLDLSKYAWTHKHGDLTVYGTWWWQGTDSPKPCLVLIPTNAQDYLRSTPAVVLIEQAWIWSEAIGDGRRAAQTAARFAQSLDLPLNMNSAMRVASIIRDHLGDLVSMKPYEAYSNDFEKVTVGKIVDDFDLTKQIGEATITERV